MDLFFAAVLLGPPLAGLLSALAGRPWWWGVLPLVLYFGVWGFVHDTFLVEPAEDQAFHVVLTLLMTATGYGGGAVGRRLARRGRPHTA